jgi:putative flippase GtrA
MSTYKILADLDLETEQYNLPGMMMKITHSPWSSQAIKFLVVGTLNTLIDVGLYLLLTRWVDSFDDIRWLAKAISYSVGVVNSFYWNKTWTFRSQTSPTKTFMPFTLANLVGVGINASMMHICLEAWHSHELLSFVVATGVSFAWNFLVSKYIFRKMEV